MGGFVAISAYRGVGVGAVAEAIAATVTSAGGRAEVGGADPSVLVREPVNGWAGVTWEPVSPYLRMAVETARLLEAPCVISDMYDGDFWRFAVADQHGVRSRFHSDPDYFDDIGPEWRSPDPEGMAATLGVDPSLIAPYVRSPRGLGGWRRGRRRRAKARPEDQHELTDAWVFTDLWQAIGIPYPYEVPAAAAVTLHQTDPVMALGEP